MHLDHVINKVGQDHIFSVPLLDHFSSKGDAQSIFCGI